MGRQGRSFRQRRLILTLSRGLIIALLWLIPVPPAVKAETTPPQALSSLQSYTGLWQMPNARVLPDWKVRLKYGVDSPYRYYGVALGLWERLEFHGQFTEVTTLPGFLDSPEYGNYKDRTAGGRLVLVKEDALWPQVAIGAYDATGTALFGSRYLVASKMFGPVDLTIGLGQGILAGEFVPATLNGAGESDRAFAFLTSDPFRTTRLFGGIEWHLASDMTISAEYSSLDYQKMFGYRATGGPPLREDNRPVPVNVGVKYRLFPKIHAQLALMGGTEIAGGLSAEFPLDAEGMLAWKKISPQKAGERARWQAYRAKNEELAQLLGAGIQAEGFVGVAVSVSDDAVWIEAANTVHLSDSRALGHIAAVADDLLPQRIETIYLNLKQYGMILQSLRTSRADLRAFLSCRTDKDNFLHFADLDLHGDAHWREFSGQGKAGPLVPFRDNRLSFQVNPRLRTFINNRKGFFKNKGVVEARADYRLWQGARLAGEYEFILFNEFSDLSYAPLEKEATRTDLVLYEQNSSPRVSMLALDQHVKLPGNVMGRLSGGIFESAYAGFGAEAFRYFHDGLWGIGLETEAVRKRDLEDNFSLRDDQKKWFNTAFVNLYGQLWPSQGLEGGLKIGRFLAGDLGARVELRRSFKYCTVGAWYTVTDTSDFTSQLNRDDRQKGVYIRLPLALFKDMDVKGHLRYLMTSFTHDPGQTVRQPSSLYPMDPWSTPDHTRRTLDDMRIQ